ncbi:Putative membrane protein C2G11.09 [Glycine soja]|uniref:Putative membrane protein C2G11.09 n=1 Tax=Glycine soja TaxID=3848 RepID=A0A0B2QB63_GLYSO|nr:Putative membrane protein C2G11.09 [Glycine soja]
MNPHSLLASAAINIGLALVTLPLFSVLKKQPSNAPIYYARPLSRRHHLPFDDSSSSLNRFLPSLVWLSRAFRVTEDEIVQAHGLDALVIIRLFKFGIKFFTVCSLVGLVVLLPTNYGAQEVQNGSYFTMDSFTISNVKRGSNRLWVHFAFLCFISLYGMYLLYKELPVAFVTFKSRSGAAAAAHLQHHSHPLLWITELAPEPRDVSWRNMRVSYRVVPLYKLGVLIAASLLTVFFAIPVTAVQGIAKYEKLKQWFPPARAVQLIPGLSSIVTGYLPSAVLKGFIYIVPLTMFAMAKIAGCIARSKEEIKACNMVFYFLVGNVFFWSVLSGSLLDLIGQFISHPKNVPSQLAGAVSAQVDFFVTYILTDGLSGFSLELLQPGMLIWDILKSCVHGCQRETSPYLYSLPYFRIIPLVSLSVLIGIVYAVVAPLLLPFLILYFCLGYVVYVNQIRDVYETTYETCGQYWPYIHHYILLAIILMQITMVGLFGLKLKPAASISTIPLILFTWMFNEYCKMRFLPSFHHYTLQDAAENDELDEKCGLLELHYENAINAYCPPGLRPVNFMASESSSTPLVSS